MNGDVWRELSRLDDSFEQQAATSTKFMVSGHHKKFHFKGTYIEDIAKTVTLRLKAPHTLMLWPSVFKIADVCGTDISGVSWFCVSDCCGKSGFPCHFFPSSKANRGLLPLTSAGSASHTARFKAAMFGLIPSIHDGGRRSSRKEDSVRVTASKPRFRLILRRPGCVRGRGLDTLLERFLTYGN